MVLMNLFAGKEWRHRYRERTYGHVKKGKSGMNRESTTNIHTQLHVKQSRWGPVCDTDSPARTPRRPKGVPCRQGTHIQTHARLIHAADSRNQHDAVMQLSCSEKNKSRHTRRRPPPPQRNPSVAPHCFRVNLLFRTLPTISPPGRACV